MEKISSTYLRDYENLKFYYWYTCEPTLQVDADHDKEFFNDLKKTERSKYNAITLNNLVGFSSLTN